MSFSYLSLRINSAIEEYLAHNVHWAADMPEKSVSCTACVSFLSTLMPLILISLVSKSGAIFIAS